MQLARVIGDVVVTRKDENLRDRTLLVLQPIGADGSPVGRTLVAVDAVGAGVGETVFFVRGKEASFPFLPDRSARRCGCRRHRRPLGSGVVTLARVVGTVVATQKHRKFEGAKLLLVQPMTLEDAPRGACAAGS